MPFDEYERQLGLGDIFTQSDGHGLADEDNDQSINDIASQANHGMEDTRWGGYLRSADSAGIRRAGAPGSNLSSSGGPLQRPQLHSKTLEDLDSVPDLVRTVGGFISDPDAHWIQPRTEEDLRSHLEEITGGSETVPVPSAPLELDFRDDTV